MPECADCGTTLDLQEDGPLFYCPECDEEIGVEERERVVDDVE